MKRLLVTGGAGFIGANFIEYWQEEHPQDFIVVLDILSYAGNKANLAEALKRPNTVFVQGSINDRSLIEYLLAFYRLDTIVNFAAESHVDRSISAPEQFVETNIVGMLNLLQAARQVWIEEPLNAGKPVLPHRFHHVSTDEVFGDLGEEGEPFSEHSRYQPSNPYAATKAASDHLLNAWARTYGLNVSLSNCSNNFGRYQYPEKLMPRMITNILFERPLTVFGNGQQVRDWLYVKDHAAGIDRILGAGKTGCNYNIGGHNEQTNLQFIQLLCGLINDEFARDASLAEHYPQALSAIDGRSQQLITHVQDRPGHDVRYAINAGKISRELGFMPQHDFAAAMLDTVRWYLQHPHWFAAH